MKISTKKSNDMFAQAAIDKKKLFESLITMGQNKANLKPALRKEWSPENPTRNFCYVVSEFLVHYGLPGSKGFSLVVPGDNYKHYFVRNSLGTIIDLTAEQFPDYSLINYDEAKKAHFMPPSPSKRARTLAKLMGYAVKD